MTALATAPARPHARPAARPSEGSALLHGTARRTATLPRAADLLRRVDREQDREELRRVRSLAAVVAVAVVETEAGRRPLRDLAGWHVQIVHPTIVPHPRRGRCNRD